MNSPRYKLLLADDDTDDCIFFKEALGELSHPACLTTVSDGVELMEYLSKNHDNLPDVIFLDLNMPRKNGFQCLNEIRNCEHLKQIPIIILSTSFEMEIVNFLFEKGARHYMRKPGDFVKLRQLIDKAIRTVCVEDEKSSSKEFFILYPV